MSMRIRSPSSRATPRIRFLVYDVLWAALSPLLALYIRDALPRYFSVRDAIDVAKAVVVGELMTCVVLFTFTRLEGIPRSTPLIHALIFGAGVVTIRALAHIAA